MMKSDLSLDYLRVEVAVAARPEPMKQDYSAPSQQYVHNLSFGRPMALTRSSSLWYFSVVNFNLFLICSTIELYFSLSVLEYSSKFLPSSFSNSYMAFLAARSNSDLDLEKFKNLHPCVRGGHAGRMCTSLAPHS